MVTARTANAPRVASANRKVGDYLVLYSCRMCKKTLIDNPDGRRYCDSICEIAHSRILHRQHNETLVREALANAAHLRAGSSPRKGRPGPRVA